MQFPPSSLKQRKQFYKKEFLPKRLQSFFIFPPQYFSIDAGTETKIIKNKSFRNFMINFGPNLPLQSLKPIAIKYLPEDVYYDRNIYKSLKLTEQLLSRGKSPDSIKTNILAQQLAFDLDVENLSCNLCKRNKKELKFCLPCLQDLKQITIKMHQQLKKLHFKELKIIYTGRGYHIHVFDTKAYTLSVNERKITNKKLKDSPIDEWVSSGEVRLIRLPYSLNALVSRIVLPLTLEQLKKFSPEAQAIPRFLKYK